MKWECEECGATLATELEVLAHTHNLKHFKYNEIDEETD